MRFYSFGGVSFPTAYQDQDMPVGARSGLVEVPGGAFDEDGAEVTLKSSVLQYSFPLDTTPDNSLDTLFSKLVGGRRLVKTVQRDGTTFRQTFAKLLRAQRGRSPHDKLVQQVDLTLAQDYPYWMATADEPLYLDHGEFLDSGSSLDGNYAGINLGDLQVSGNEITDVTRAALVQGDGRAAPDSSFGFWQASANYIQNGGCETNTTGWAAAGLATISRVTTEHKFGAACLKVENPGGATNQGVIVKTATGIGFTGAARTEVGSVWLKGAGTVDVWLRVTYTDVSETDSAHLSYPLTGTWTRVVPATVTLNAAKTVDFFEVHVRAPGSSAITFYCDGAQVEDQVTIATPYIHTDGALVSRNDPLVTFPAEFLSETQGWFAVRWRAGWGSSREPNITARLACWRDDDDHRIELFAAISTSVWGVRRQSPSLQQSAQIDFSSIALTKDSAYTIVGAWTATQLKLSVNGSAFGAYPLSTLSSTNIPVIATDRVCIGSAPTGGACNGDILWAAWGSGTLTDADAVTLNAFGNTDPTMAALPGTPRRVWTADRGLGSDVVAVISNAGGVPVRRGQLVVIPAAGASITDLTITNAANQMSLRYSGSVTYPQYLVLDLLSKSAKRDAVSGYANIYTPAGQMDWMQLEVGTNVLTIEVGARTGNTTFEYHWSRHWV